MQQTQPLISKPAPALTQSAAMTRAPAISSSPAMQVESGPDTATTVLSILALVLSLGALACAYLVFKATELPV
jgi:hypothetical protein